MGNKEFLTLVILGAVCIAVVVGLIYLGMFIYALVGVIAGFLILWCVCILADYFYDKYKGEKNDI